MRYLLDTHSLLWWLNDDRHLSQFARETISFAGNDIFVSAASAWEIATKFMKGRLPAACLLIPDFQGVLQRANFIELPINSMHMVRSAQLPGTHRDPFDRILAAQAIVENMKLISIDREMITLGAPTVW